MLNHDFAQYVCFLWGVLSLSTLLRNQKSNYGEKNKERKWWKSAMLRLSRFARNKLFITARENEFNQPHTKTALFLNLINPRVLSLSDVAIELLISQAPYKTQRNWWRPPSAFLFNQRNLILGCARVELMKTMLIYVDGVEKLPVLCCMDMTAPAIA